MPLLNYIGPKHKSITITFVVWPHSKIFVPKTGVSENRIGEYFGVFEKRKRRKPLFAGQKAMNEVTP